MELDVYQMANLALDESTPPHVLHELSKRPEELILVNLASNSSTPEETLLALYRSRPSLVNAIAGNKSCPNQLLLEIAKSATSMTAIENICENPSATSELLLKLVSSGILRVQELVARNALITSEIIDVLIKSEYDAVITALASNKCLRSTDFMLICDKKNLDALEAIAGNESCPQDILYLLHKKDLFQTQAGLARNNNIPVDILADLSLSKSQPIRYRVASNIRADRDILLRLTIDNDINVRQAAYENPSFVACLSDYEIRNLFSGRILARELFSSNTALSADVLFDRLADERGKDALANVVENLKFRGREYWESLPIELIDPERLCGTKKIPLHALLTKFKLSEVQEAIASILLKRKVDELPMTSFKRLRTHL
ncbi:TPA: hypothetical protein RQN23_000663 [Aeromonas veronii]|nr:hypothetical protein [Aeromonas veronii]